MQSCLDVFTGEHFGVELLSLLQFVPQSFSRLLAVFELGFGLADLLSE